jgi:hypothetical protein
MSEEQQAENGNNIIVVDMGKKRRKQVKRLRNGEGKLMDKVQEVIASMREDGSSTPGDTIVVVVERKADFRAMRAPFKW